MKIEPELAWLSAAASLRGRKVRDRIDGRMNDRAKQTLTKETSAVASVLSTRHGP
jgi:hypothetical protein